PDHGLDRRPAPPAAGVGQQQPCTATCHTSHEKEEHMTWQIWDEHRDHRQAHAGSLRRGWAPHVKVEHAAWPQATMTGLGLLLALGGVWGLHEQGGRASSTAAPASTHAPLLAHLQAVMIGTLSWCAAVLVVATCFLGLMLLAARIQQRHSRSRSV